MIAALFLAAALAAAPATPVQLRTPICAWSNEADVRRVLAVELRDRLLEARASIPAGSLTAAVECPGDEVVVVSVARPGEAAPRVRGIPRDAAEGQGGARTLALALAELVRVADAPLPSTAGAPTPPAGAPPAVASVSGELKLITTIGVAGAAFSSGSALLGGGGVAWTGLWRRPDRPWAFGATFVFDGLSADFWSGLGGLSILSLGPAAVVQRVVGRFRPEVAIGERFGFARFNGGVGSDQRHGVGGPFASVALTFVIARGVAVRAAVDGVLPLATPGTYCSATSCVTFDGPWLLASLKGSVGY